MDRFLAVCGSLAGVGALAFALQGWIGAWRPKPHAQVPVSISALPSVSAPSYAVPTLPNDGTQVWSRLRADLRLDELQGEELAQILVACDRGVREAGKHPDALWQDRLIRRAHRDAFDATVIILSREQYKDFLVWLDAPSNASLATWFTKAEKCKGCAKK